MAFDCTYSKLPIEAAARLTRDTIAERAREHGLGSVYVVAHVRVLPRRWRRHVVDLVVHMADGVDILDAQFPDEAKAAVTAAIASLLHELQAVTGAPPRSRPAPLPPPGRTARA